MRAAGIGANFEKLFRVVSGFEFSRTVSWERLNRPGELSAVLREGRMKDGIESSYEDIAKRPGAWNGCGSKATKRSTPTMSS